MAEKTFDLVVIGAGPGGYVAAIRAAQVGMRVACVEKEFLGGVCLNIGCIPSKALLDSTHLYYAAKHLLPMHGVRVGEVSMDVGAMMKRKEEVVRGLTNGVGYLFKKNKVEHIEGTARIVSPGRVEVSGVGEVRAERILIATGSAPTQIPGLPIDEQYIVSSTGGLAFGEVPKRLAIVGAGYIGLELGSVWMRLGSEVVVLEALDRALPGMDAELAGQLRRILEKQGMKFRFRTVAESARVVDGKVELTWASGGERGVEAADKVLVAVGRRPNTAGLGLAEIGVEMDAKGFIKVGKHFQTNVKGVYAIGDVIGGLMLAHKAEEEGATAVERMVGIAGHVNYAACPMVVYTHPELAAVGMTEEEAAKRGAIKVGKFPLSANGRAKAMAEPMGMVKMVADARTDQILGVHILASHASDMIAEAVLAMEFGGSCEDVARSFHGHPTLAEAVKEAALGVAGRAIHI